LLIQFRVVLLCFLCSILFEVYGVEKQALTLNNTDINAGDEDYDSGNKTFTENEASKLPEKTFNDIVESVQEESREKVLRKNMELLKNHHKQLLEEVSKISCQSFMVEIITHASKL
jgi:hypothetical protein